MACINPNKPDCKHCNKAGLAILPVRYTVVPQNVPATLPEPLGNKVTDIKLQHHQYALRTLRQGFLYLYYEKHPHLVKWEVYSVAPDGSVWKQLAPKAAQPYKAPPPCALSKGHPPGFHAIAIEEPERQGKVWMAFSEHIWSSETLKAFETDDTLRDKRMQTFLPAVWVKTPAYRHGLAATQKNIEQILEYQDNFNIDLLTDVDPTVQPESNRIEPVKPVVTLSKSDGSYRQALLKQQSTRYPLYMRRGKSQEMADLLEKVGDMGSTKHPAMIMALWDAVGITHELNGFRNDAAGRIEQYDAEQALKVAAFNSIAGLKKALADQAVQGEEQLQQDREQACSRPNHATLNAERVKASTLTEPQRSRMLGFWDDMEYVSDNKLPTRFERSLALMKQTLLNTPANQPYWNTERQRIMSEARMYAQAAPHMAERNKNYVIAKSWEKYEPKIDPKVFRPFEKNYQRFQRVATTLVSRRTEDLIAWLKSPYLIHALHEFHQANIYDGVVFDDTIGHAIHGINSSANGKAQIEAWVNALEATDENLIWRSLALNQTEAIEELNKTLVAAEEAKAKRTASEGLALMNYVNKSLKAFADTYKKATSLYNANESANSAKGSRAFGIKLSATRSTLGLDRVMMTAGDTIFKRFQINELADKHCESLIKYLLGVRGLVEPADMGKILVEEAKNAGIVRGQILKRLDTARTFMAADTPPIQSAQAAELDHAWQEFKKTNSGAPNAIKDARLALVVMLIEGMNFSKLMGDCALKNDAKSWFSLAASGMSIASALFDIASIPIKNTYGAESWSYQRLKLCGGVLSGGATAIGAFFDAKDMVKYFGRGQSVLSAAYFFKAVSGISSAILTAATTFTYAAPLIGRLTGNPAISTAARLVGSSAARIIGVRILCMSLGAWLTVGVFGIQVFIWMITDNELQDWCSLCAFGVNRSAKDAYKTAEEQNHQLQEACKAVGV